MRLLISGGGTGGHVYPALAVAEALLKHKSTDNLQPMMHADQPSSPSPLPPTLTPTELLWIGSKGGIEQELVAQAGIQVIGLAAGGLRGMNLASRAQNAARIVSSLGKARSILAEFRPDVVLVTGGYACVAVTLTAWLKRVPVLIYLPDIEPGLAVRLLSRLATQVAVTSQESCKHLPRNKVVVTGYPVRSDLFQLDRVQAQRALSLDPTGRTLLVFGGSRGSRSINRALVAGLREILPVCQVVHVSGRLDAEWVAADAGSLPKALQPRYHHHAYLHAMPLALVAADLVVARAGAATLGEFPAAGLPSILVPYPYSGQHQAANADFMARSGAARVLPDAELDQKLVPAVLQLLSDHEALERMHEAARAVARPDAAEAIARQLWLVAQRCAAGGAGARS